MNTPTTIYEYRLLKNPSEADVNRMGAEGYRVHSMALDPRDGALAYIVMERSGEAVMVIGENGTVGEYERKTPARGRR